MDGHPPKAGQHIRPKDIEPQPKILGILPVGRLQRPASSLLDVSVGVSARACSLSPIGNGRDSLGAPFEKQAAGIGQQDPELSAVVRSKVADCLLKGSQDREWPRVPGQCREIQHSTV